MTSQHHHAIPPVIPPPNCFTVLIVDDTEVLRTVLKRSFESIGYAAVTAVDPVEALEMLSEGRVRPDLIVTDVEMPRMDGIEFVKRVRASGETYAELPILTTSGAERDEVEPQALAAGSDGFLPKPFHISGLKREVSQILKRRRKAGRGLGSEVGAARNRLRADTPLHRP